MRPDQTVKHLVVVLAVGVLLAPVFLLHGFVGLARLFEPKLRGATVTTVAWTNGHSLRVYRRDEPGACATLVFIHGSPATASAFHRQFDEPFPNANLLASNVDYLEGELRAAGGEQWLARRILPEARHFIPWEQPAALRAAIQQVRDEALATAAEP